jgi:hypothetical protein
MQSAFNNVKLILLLHLKNVIRFFLNTYYHLQMCFIFILKILQTFTPYLTLQSNVNHKLLQKAIL